MDPELERQIAAALECGPDLLPFMPELLADLEELGGSSRELVELLRPLDLPAGSRVVDLGCGKGAGLIALAGELSFTCVGIDGFPPFIEAARSAAANRGVADRCQFRCGDLRDVAATGDDFDVAMMIGVGLAVGDQRQIVGILRRCVRPGGYMVIDDAFLPDGAADPVPEYEGYADHETTLGRLEAFGDRLLVEHRAPGGQREREIQAQTVRIRRRAERLMERHPEAAGRIRDYVRRQEREAELARADIVDAIWLLRRTA